MKILIQHKWKSADTVEGELFINGIFFCYTLERADSLRIPNGTYPVEFTYSPKFGRVMPLIIVPGREGIRFHSGATYMDSEGCVLLGDKRLSGEQIGGGLSDGIVESFEQHLKGASNIAVQLTEEM